jgi:hypothetical protein
MALCGGSSCAAVTLSVLAVFPPPSVSLPAVSGTALAFLLVALASALDPALTTMFGVVSADALAFVLVAPASVLIHAPTAAVASTLAATGLAAALTRMLAGLCL